MGNTYENRVNQLIEQYGLLIEDFIDSMQIHNIILELLQKKCLKKKVALWGAGYNNSLTSHASILLTKYATCLQGVEFLIDSCKELQGKEFLGRPIIAPEELPTRDVDIVIISSRSSAGSILESLHKFLPECESLDIYQELRNQGIDIHYNFYEERNFYSEIYDNRIIYENANGVEKDDALFKLISSYLYIKDFYYANLYIDEYIKKGYRKSVELSYFKKELQAIINEVKEANRNRKDDITLHYIDAVRAIDIYGKDKNSYNYFGSILKDSAVFKQMYSTAPTTYESMYTATTGKSSFTENVYEDKFIFDLEQFAFMNKAYEKGYKLNLFSSAEWRILKESEKINYIDQIHMTDKLWSLACETAVADGPTFNYVYYPWELHFPLLCGYHTNKPVAMGCKDVGVVDMSYFIEAQLVDSLTYVDKQLEYFSDICASDGYVAIFSDHSQIVYDEEKLLPMFAYYREPERSTHCIFSIKGAGIEHKEIEKLTSLADMNQILEDYIWNKQYEIPKRTEVLWQYYSTHNKVFRDIAEEKGMQDYIDGVICYMSKEFLYAKTNTGVEEVYHVGDYKTNIINQEEGKKFAMYINEKYKIEFPSFLEMHY